MAKLQSTVSFSFLRKTLNFFLTAVTCHRNRLFDHGRFDIPKLYGAPLRSATLVTMLFTSKCGAC